MRLRAVRLPPRGRSRARISRRARASDDWADARASPPPRARLARVRPAASAPPLPPPSPPPRPRTTHPPRRLPPRRALVGTADRRVRTRVQIRARVRLRETQLGRLRLPRQRRRARARLRSNTPRGRRRHVQTLDHHLRHPHPRGVPRPFPFHGGCKFDEGARGGPCFARAANAARVAEGKKPRACTGDAHPGCFHRQGRAFFLAWALNWYLCQKAAHDFAFATLSHTPPVAAHDPLANLGLYADPATSLTAWATMLAIGLNNNSSVEMPRVFVTMHAFRWGGWFVASRTAALRRAKRWL